MKSHRKYFLILVTLVAVFLSYNFNIYTDNDNYGSVYLSKKALQGEQLWLKNNCNSCHQLYGLGGYLGPDLTNVYSSKGKGETYIKAMINSGIKSMPKFNFTENEKDELVQFFKEIDKTGHYPNINARIEKNGWVKMNYKNVKYEN